MNVGGLLVIAAGICAIFGNFVGAFVLLAIGGTIVLVASHRN